MLRLAGTTTIPATPQIEFAHGFWIWWEELRGESPASWWSIDAPGHYLLVEVRSPTGVLTSVECPLRCTVIAHSASLWARTNMTEGHPVFEPTLPPWKVCPELGVEGFGFDYSPTEIRLHWGAAARSIRSGRCMFGLNEGDELVSVGLTNMTEDEYGTLRVGLGKPLFEKPASQLLDWQLSAHLAGCREQRDSSLAQNVSLSDATFVMLDRRVRDLEREIERRRGSR